MIECSEILADRYILRNGKMFCWERTGSKMKIIELIRNEVPPDSLSKDDLSEMVKLLSEEESKNA